MLPLIRKPQSRGADRQKAASPPETTPGAPLPGASGPAPSERAALAGDGGSEKPGPLDLAALEEHGKLLTLEGNWTDASYPITARHREIFALFETGLFLVANTYASDPLIESFVSRMRRSSLAVELRKVEVEPKFLRDVYVHLRSNGRSSDTEEGLRRDVLRFIAEARRQGATDFHISVQPPQGRSVIRFRIDGNLVPHKPWPADYGMRFLRLLYLLDPDAGEPYNELVSQDAQVSRLKVEGLPKDVEGIRLKYVPTGSGGRVLFARFITSTFEVSTLEGLDYTAEQLRTLEDLRARPSGMIVFSGVIGSGKSTTLKLNLERLYEERNGNVNTASLEDPIEYPSERIHQMVVPNGTAEEKAAAYQKGLEDALRCDLNVFMLGETRTAANARVLFDLCMTGLQVWTTIHAPEAITVLDRLKSMGIEDYKIYNHNYMAGLGAQRLLPKLCPHCRISVTEAQREALIAPALVERLKAAVDVPLATIFVANPDGCQHCIRGYRGRTVVAEIIRTTEEFMNVARQGYQPALRRYWINQMGGYTMMRHAVDKMGAGVVSPLDVERFTKKLSEFAEDLPELGGKDETMMEAAGHRLRGEAGEAKPRPAVAGVPRPLSVVQGSAFGESARSA